MNPVMIVSEKQVKNIYFMNGAKTLAMFLIILGHLPIPHNVYSFINCFRMPLFFIITGYLISVDFIPFKKMAIKKVRTLLLPYALFALISLLYWFFVGKHYGDDALDEHHTAKYVIGALCVIPTKEYLGFNFAIWFLPALFCTEILFYWGRKIFKKQAWIAFIGCFGLGVLFKEIHLYRLPYGIDVSLFALLFIQIGQWLKNKHLLEKYSCNSSPTVKIGCTIVFFGLTCLFSQINQAHGSISMVNRIFNNYILYFAGAFSGSLFLLYLSNCVPALHVFDFYGRNTILLLGFHGIALSLIKGVQVFLFHIPLEITEDFGAIYILYVLLTFILLTPVIYFVNIYTPFLLGRKKGIL
jgi:fucose 4-O-acetylase-like acetyltransferase